MTGRPNTTQGATMKEELVDVDCRAFTIRGLFPHVD